MKTSKTTKKTASTAKKIKVKDLKATKAGGSKLKGGMGQPVKDWIDAS